MGKLRINSTMNILSSVVSNYYTIFYFRLSSSTEAFVVVKSIEYKLASGTKNNGNNFGIDD